MRIVAGRQTEVPHRALARLLQHVLPRAQRLYHCEREVGEAQWVRLAAADQELLERDGIGIVR